MQGLISQTGILLPEKIICKSLTILSNTEVFPLFLVSTVAAPSSQEQLGKKKALNVA